MPIPKNTENTAILIDTTTINKISAIKPKTNLTKPLNKVPKTSPPLLAILLILLGPWLFKISRSIFLISTGSPFIMSLSAAVIALGVIAHNTIYNQKPEPKTKNETTKANLIQTTSKEK